MENQLSIDDHIEVLETILEYTKNSYDAPVSNLCQIKYICREALSKTNNKDK